MPKSGCEKLVIHLENLLKDAHHARKGEVALLRNVPVITSKQLIILDQRNEVRGVYKKHVGRDFHSALRHHRDRQLRAYAHNCHRKARALRRLIKDYMEMPGI